MPHTTPPTLEGLVRLSRKEGVDVRPALLRVLTDLYVQEKSHTREEEQQYVELAFRLLPAVDAPTRAAVASKLGGYPLAPAQIVEQLAGDIPEVAELIRGRPALPCDWTLQAPGEVEPSMPETVRPTDAIPGRFAPVADDREAGEGEAVIGAARATGLGEMFLQADPAQRRRLLAEQEQKPSGGLADTVADKEIIRRLEQAALQRNQREFARELQHALRLSRQTALRIARDPSGEPLVVVAWALAMPAAALQRILLFLNPVIGESVERVFALSRLYDELSPHAAMPIVAGWREEATHRAAVRYVGVHADEPGTGGAALMDNARRSITGRTGEAARRVELSRARGFNQRTT
jgi:hypothetical protein